MRQRVSSQRLLNELQTVFGMFSSVFLFLFDSVCLFVCLFICLFVYLFVCLFVCHFSLYLSIFLLLWLLCYISFSLALFSSLPCLVLFLLSLSFSIFVAQSISMPLALSLRNIFKNLVVTLSVFIRYIIHLSLSQYLSLRVPDCHSHLSVNV